VIESQDGNVKQNGADVCANTGHREIHIAAEDGAIWNRGSNCYGKVSYASTDMYKT